VGGVFNGRTGLPIDVLIPQRPDVVYIDTRNNTVVASPILVGGTPVTTAVINVPGGGLSRNVRRPNVVAGVNPYINVGGTQFLNPAAFSTPAPGTFGNFGRNALHGPNLTQFDLTLHKRFSLTERLQLQFNAEIYNLFNKTNFANPNSSLSTAIGTGTNQLQPNVPYTQAAAGSFGQITSTVERTVGLGASRQIQMSLRLMF
jgi:hypothetical protein